MENLRNDLRCGVEEIAAVAAAEVAGLRVDMQSSTKEVKRDVAGVLTTVRECHNYNMTYFQTFTEGLGATQRGIDTLRVRVRRNCLISLFCV